jgi:glycosyltransferase involved in cell wall biosynthesis
MKFDVVLATMNSVSRIGEVMFRNVLKAICTRIPVNKLLAVDDGSQDQTFDVLRQFHAIFIKGQGSLGKAREIGIRNAETPWFYFVDDDNLVTPGFHGKMCKHIDERTGMIFPRAIIPYDSYNIKYEKLIWKFRSSLGLREAVLRRSYTGATLINKGAVEGIRIPAVARQEDYYIKKHCEENGWKVKYAPEAVVWHVSPALPSLRTNYLEGRGMAVVGAISKTRMLASWLLTYPKCLFALPYVRNRELLIEIPRMYFVKYKGYIDGRNQLGQC